MTPLFRIAAPALALLIAPVAHARCTFGAPGTTAEVSLGEGRKGTVHVPARSKGGALPVLFLFHGSGDNGALIVSGTGMATTADANGFLIVAPNGGIPHERGYVWNIPGVPSVSGRMPDAKDADDAAFVTRTIDRLAAQGCIDRTRVYAAGFSGGARMTSLLGCMAADRIAAIAPVAGLRAGRPLASDPKRPDPATCRPKQLMPVIAFAGDADPTNPPQGGGGPYWQYSMRTALARWATLNGCRGALATRALTAQLYEERYTRCRGGAQVTARITRGAAHVWAADNAVMWAFLAKHRRR